MNAVDVIIIGAGAAGLFCAGQAGARGRRVLVLEKSNKPGKKILMSGGGRCNFTNLDCTPEQYLSHNASFCKSALNRYTQWDFIALVEQHQIAYFEKTAGQLFCEHKSSQIVDLLIQNCDPRFVRIQLNEAIESVFRRDDGRFLVKSKGVEYQSTSLVVATGGLSIPTLGASPFGYQLATQFGLPVYPTRAGLVPFTWHTHDKVRYEPLSGISVDCDISCNGQSFHEQLLFTHRGLSGPAALQISSYWYPGDVLEVRLLPTLDLASALLLAARESPDSHLKTILSNWFPKRLIAVFLHDMSIDKPMKQYARQVLQQVAAILQAWRIKPNATEGYRTAEVTLGGVDCNAVSSQRFEAHAVPGLFFIGEVLDVSGWLGGYNFQWAWSSAWAAGQVV